MWVAVLGVEQVVGRPPLIQITVAVGLFELNERKKAHV